MHLVLPDVNEYYIAVA